MPVAGPVGLGSASLADELGSDKLKIIGVDGDWTATDPGRKGVYLTSVMKNMDATTLSVIEMAKSGDFAGGLKVGTLDNGGVGIAPYHDLSSSVSSELASEVEALRKGIISGSIKMN